LFSSRGGIFSVISFNLICYSW